MKLRSSANNFTSKRKMTTLKIPTVPSLPPQSDPERCHWVGIRGALLFSCLSFINYEVVDVNHTQYYMLCPFRASQECTGLSCRTTTNTGGCRRDQNHVVGTLKTPLRSATHCEQRETPSYDKVGCRVTFPTSQAKLDKKLYLNAIFRACTSFPREKLKQRLTHAPSSFVRLMQPALA